MNDLISKKAKVIIGLIGATYIGMIALKNIIEFKNHNMLKRIDKKIFKYSWEYYD